MNVNTNYSVKNNYLRNNIQHNKANTTSPAFKMSEKIVQRGLVSAALAAAYAGVTAKKEEPQGITLDNVKEFLKGRKNFDNVKDVNNIVNNKPEIVNRLLSLKKPDGTQFFSEYDIIYKVLDNNINLIKTNPEKLFAVLENPAELAGMRTPKLDLFESAMLYHALKHPLDSTREANPGLFEPEEPITVDSVAKIIMDMDAENDFKLEGLKMLYSHPELVDKLASIKDSVGHQYLDSLNIGNFISNFAPYSNSAKCMDRLNKFIEDPSIASYVEGFMSRGFGLWKYAIDY